MKKLLKKLVIFLLRKKAQKVLNSGAKVIAVTGSMGKTTAKESIVHILKKKYRVLASQEGFNTEIGILLTLLGEKESGFSSPIKWLQILWRVCTQQGVTNPCYQNPEIIVLEFGVDKPGDMDALLNIAQPDYAVVTNVAPVHLAKGQFENIEQIAKEKMKLPQSLSSEGMAILNGDNQYIHKRGESIAAHVVNYGAGVENDGAIKNLQQNKEGIEFTVSAESETQTFSLPFFGKYHTTVILPAILLAREFGIDFTQSAQLLKNFTPPPGRGRILAGKNKSVIWDASYNSAPQATLAALRALLEIPAQRRLALLGNMNELGEQSAEFHKELGRAAVECCDEIFFVGEESESFQKGVNGEKPLRIFPTAEEAGEHIRNVLQKDDLILIKGSQNGVFLERAVAKLLAKKEDTNLLCRQGEEWEEK